MPPYTLLKQNGIMHVPILYSLSMWLVLTTDQPLVTVNDIKESGAPNPNACFESSNDPVNTFTDITLTLKENLDPEKSLFNAITRSSSKYLSEEDFGRW